MRIEVSAVGADGLVSFRCRAGTGAGVWKAEEPPEVGLRYSVEVDVDGEVGPRPAGAAAVRLDGTSVVLAGRWRVTEDGATYLEVAGSLVSVEVADGDTTVDGELVQVVAGRAAVRLFPFFT
ncbi:hypothetical protein GCM10011609_56050 [Lentzea pudingi]|uniref:Uncharacterized protein n=1 Tax=Lentzea pudingi TaxID=1789439 RepID=A0ABQ2IIF5_9PSEU|nr:hypothetical protein [Lentzea pudingi]GGN09105.1 hypothetical protein GCM10011609_56050 [Lentzea pudingi]